MQQEQILRLESENLVVRHLVIVDWTVVKLQNVAQVVAPEVETELVLVSEALVQNFVLMRWLTQE